MQHDRKQKFNKKFNIFQKQQKKQKKTPYGANE